MLHIGTILDRRYRIDYVIKQGGMGTVYGAHDLRLDRPCAVKAVPATSAREAAQFEREARVLGRLCHPHLPAIYDCLTEAGVVFVVMQMIPGDDLEGVTMRCGTPGWETLVGWALQLAGAVQYLHDQTPPVIHRDIKPANIRLAAHGQVYLVDFGIAKLLDGAVTVTAARAASVPYAPIEQLQDGSHTDQRSDIYAFGATLYRLLTATLPPSCIDRLVGKDMLPVSGYYPSVPAELEALIHDCMELWNADRPATMRDIIDRLRATRAPGVVPANAGRTASIARSELANPRAVKAPEPGTNAHGAFQAGQQALEKGDATAARTHFTQAIELARTFAEAYAARALAHTQMGLVEAAINDWDAAIAQEPRRAAWYLHRAVLRRERHDTAAALADLSMAIQLDPTRTEAYVERAVTHGEVGDTRGQLKDLDRVLSLAPGHREARLARARARIEQQLWQSALADCSLMVEAEPDRPTGYLLRARVYTEMGDTARALRDLAQAVAADARCAEAFFLRGRLLQRSGDRQAALRDFSVALTIDEAYAEARYRRAKLYRVLGAEREALADYRALTRQLRSQWARHSGDEPALATSDASRHPIFVEVEFLMQTASIEKARRHVHAHTGSFSEDSDEDLEERAALFERVGLVEAALDDMERAAEMLLSRQDAVQLPVS